MKNILVTMVLSMAVGLSVPNVPVQAASTQDCYHAYYLYEKSIDYYIEANSEYHWVYGNEYYRCLFCKSDYIERYEDYEEHSFDDYRDGGRYCSGCGAEDEFYY